MKARTYYMLSTKSPKGAIRLLGTEPKHMKPKHGGFDVPVKVIRVSDLDKVIERAAKALYEHAHVGSSRRPWRQMTGGYKDIFRDQARTAYRAGGLVP